MENPLDLVADQLHAFTSDVERSIVVLALINAAIFYAITATVFMVAQKSRLNYALGLQKLVWLAIIVLIALPAYWLWGPILHYWVRVALWSLLSVLSWWVLYEVYRANWKGTISQYFRHIWCRLHRREHC